MKDQIETIEPRINIVVDESVEARITAPGHSCKPIDACHIIPFSRSYDDTISNGIALCPNLHRAFDRGLIGVDKNYKVIVSKVFKEDETNYSLRSLKGKEILFPHQINYYPSLNNFKWHRENIFKD